MNDGMTIRFAAGYRAFYGVDYILYSISTIYKYVEKIIVAITDTPQVFSLFNRYKPEITEEFIKRYPDPDRRIAVIKGSWGATLLNSDSRRCEGAHSNAILDYIRNKNPELNYLLILDTDEILTDEGIAGLIEAIKIHPEAYAFKMSYRTYWKGLHYIAQEETCSATVCIKITPDVKFTNIRDINKKEAITLKKGIYYHHPAYALSSKKLLMKLKTFGHAKEIRKNWYKNVWKTWDGNKNLNNLHPLFSGSWWKKAIRIDDDEAPQILKAHPYFPYDTVDDFEKAMQDKEKSIDLWIPR